MVTILVLILHTVLGAVAFDYALEAIAGENISWFFDLLIGFFFGYVTVPVAIVCWICKLFGVQTPFLDD